MKIYSIRFRLTLLFVAIFGSTLIGLSIAGYQFYVRNQQDVFDASLLNHAIDVASAINVDAFGRLILFGLNSTDIAKIQPFSLERSYMQIRSTNGSIMTRSLNLEGQSLPLSNEEMARLPFELLLFKTIPSSRMPAVGAKRSPSYRHVSYYVTKPGIPPLILQIAVPMTYIESSRDSLRLFLLFAIPSVLLIATISGYDLSRRALSPVSGIIAKAERIGVGELSQRIPVPPIKDEIYQLATTFNKLLERIEASVRANERFVANASHQIKTPLAILKGELEVFLKGSRSEEEKEAFFNSASEEIEALSQLIEKLLVLANVDAGAQNLKLEVEPLDEIVFATVARLKPLAAAKNIVTKVDISSEVSEDAAPELEVKCDAGLVGTLFQSLIENALKFAPAHSTIEVRISDLDTRVAVDVVDHGPGIPQEALKHIFDRFYRAPTSEVKTQGFGLGLAIAKRIVEIHGGTIEVSSVPNKETKFRVELPKALTKTLT